MDRVAYIINRLLQMIPILIILAVLIFLMIHMIPGDPVLTLLGVMATPEKIKELNEHLGLDKPLWMQFWLFVQNLSHGDLGESLLLRQKVGAMVVQRLPLTLTLVAYAMVLSALIAFPVSLVAALKKDSLFDQIVRAVSVALLATPGFWVGILLLILLGVKIPIFPVGGAGNTFPDRLYYLFLPAFTMSLHVAAVLTRNMRDGIISTLNSDHVVFARAKGLVERLVLVKHVLRNAMIPAVTLFGLYIGWMVGGSVIMESVFALPGMGSGMVNAIMGRDYPVVQGFTLVYAVMVSLVYLITDVAYSFVDPRITL